MVLRPCTRSVTVLERTRSLNSKHMQDGKITLRLAKIWLDYMLYSNQISVWLLHQPARLILETLELRLLGPEGADGPVMEATLLRAEKL